jgi:hypothetical protein
VGTVDIGKEAVPEFATGNGTIGTSADHLPQHAVRKHVVVRANGGNANIVQVGHSADAVANGFILSAGQMTPPIYIDDLSKVWVLGGAASQGYSWIAS